MKKQKQPEQPKKRGRGQPRKEPTVVKRMPVALVPEFEKLLARHKKKNENKS